MNHQLAMAYPAEYVGRQAWERQLDAIRAAVKHLGSKEVAFVLDVSATNLSDALNERDRKHWHAHWTHVLKAMLAARAPGDEHCGELLREIAELDVTNTPFMISEDAEMTPEEESAALRRELLKMGEPGRAALDRVKRRGGRRR